MVIPAPPAHHGPALIARRQREGAAGVPRQLAEHLQTHVPVAACLRDGGGGDAATVVGHLEDGRAALLADPYLDVARLRVRLDVPQRLLARPVQDLVGLRTEAGRRVDRERDPEAFVLETCGEVGQGGPEPGLLEVRRVDADDRRSEGADARPRGGCRVAEGRTGPTFLTLRRCRQLHRESRELLHRAVVEVASDAFALQIRRGDGPLEEALPVELRALDPPGEDPRQRDLERGERNQRHHQHRRERREELALAARDARDRW
jgi:hypothetical protein